MVSDWYADKAGKKIVVDTLALWRLSPSARKLIQSLPVEVASDPDSPVLQEQLLANLLRSPDAEQALARLLANVFADTAAPDLISRMLRRIESQAGGGGLPVCSAARRRCASHRGDAAVSVAESAAHSPAGAAGAGKAHARSARTGRATMREPRSQSGLNDLCHDSRRRHTSQSGRAGSRGRRAVGPVVTVMTHTCTSESTGGAGRDRGDSFTAVAAVAAAGPGRAEPKPLPLREIGVARLHAMGHRGKGSLSPCSVPIFAAGTRRWRRRNCRRTRACSI